MAGARIEFEVDTTLASTALQRALGVLGGDGLTLLLSDIGEYLLRSTRDRAALEQAPDGSHWRALEPSYARWKGRKRPGVPILKFDNHMLGDRLAHQVDGSTLYVGTNAPYGAIHQFGGTIHIAARSQQAYFHHSKGEVSPQFVDKRKANFAQWVTLPAYDIDMPARPFLGISDQDASEIVQITQDHLQTALSGSAA
ncbi:phage virion morphogenesis protein [Fulvimonas yonginensis]|uniref:Phage virion morphogenesis protein n=1 Tax=Fulvimonas yonginensis TaxID=1495200 RepID=A0ABU8JAY4_9GAMM